MSESGLKFNNESRTSFCHERGQLAVVFTSSSFRPLKCCRRLGWIRCTERSSETDFTTATRKLPHVRVSGTKCSK